MDENVCAICLESNTDTTLNCKHVYHESCITLLNQRMCPCCRGEITSPEHIVQKINQNIIDNSIMSNFFLQPISVDMLYLFSFYKIVTDVYDFINSSDETISLGDDDLHRDQVYHIPIHFKISTDRSRFIITDFIFACRPENNAEWSNDIDIERTYTITNPNGNEYTTTYTIREQKEIFDHSVTLEFDIVDNFIYEMDNIFNED